VQCVEFYKKRVVMRKTKILSIIAIIGLVGMYTCLLQGMTNQALFEHKNILILGGTGYLGRALTTEVLKYNPQTIFIFSRDEVKHFNCEKIFNHNPKIKSIIGDIRDYESVLQATRAMDIVIHAAALKRIDMLEVHVQEAVRTNIIGSLNVFNACVVNNVPKVLFISTDKACLPINAYGACKFISEKIFTNYDKERIATKFMVARYGNVLESTGSVIPIFAELIKKGADLLLTDEQMTRFIIHKQEAVNLIFDVLRYGEGGEIFVKRLPAFKITDLIEVLQNKFNSKTQVKITGIRPGEKLHEFLVNKSEAARTFAFNDYLIITPSIHNGHWHSAEKAPVYITRGQRVSLEHFCHEYSSEHALISQEALAELFQKLEIAL